MKNNIKDNTEIKDLIKQINSVFNLSHNSIDKLVIDQPEEQLRCWGCIEGGYGGENS